MLKINWFIAWPVAMPQLPERLGKIPDGVRAFAPSDLHVTLAFLGNVQEKAALKSFDTLDLAAMQPLDVTFGAIGLMGHPKRGTALAAQIAKGRDRLSIDIVAQRDEALSVAKARSDTREPIPHMTVARMRRTAGRRERKASLAWADTLSLKGLGARLDRIALFTWSDDRLQTQFKVAREARLEASPTEA